MREELLPGLDGGVDAQACVDSYMSSANNIKKDDCTFVKDFFRSPNFFFVGEKTLSQYLQEHEYEKNDRSQWMKNGVAVSDDDKKNAFKGLVKSQVEGNRIDESMLAAFVDQWNQHYFYASNFFPLRFPFFTDTDRLVKIFSSLKPEVLPSTFDSNGDWIVHIIPTADAIKIEIKKKLGYKINGELRSFSDLTQTLIFKNVAKPDEKPRYAVSHQSTEMSNPKVKALLEKPYANREYRLQRELLCEMRKPKEENDSGVDNLLAVFDQMVIDEVKQSQDCRHMDLSGVNLSELNLSGKNFSSANLTGAILIGAKLPHDLKSDFTVKYRGAEFKHQDDVLTMINSMRDAYYRKTGSLAPQINNIFELLRYIQENPKQDFSKAADRELWLTAIRKLAAMPLRSEAIYPVDHVSVVAWSNAANDKGLYLSFISNVIEHAKINYDERTQNTKMQTKENTNTNTNQIFFQEINGNDRTVINVTSVLKNKTDEVNDGTVDANDFAAFIADVSCMKNDDGSQKIIDCIQMPLAVMEGGRRHYVQLQIFKTLDGGIGGRIIDSTVISYAIPIDFVKRLLNENKEQLKTVLGADKNVVTVTEETTREQLNVGDSKCGIYVAAGMKATVEKVLAEGAGFLSKGDKAKDAVRHQHHLVSKTEPMGYLMGMVTISNVPQPVAESVASASVGRSAQSMKTVPPQPGVVKPSAVAVGNDDDDDDLQRPLMLSPHEKEAGVSAPFPSSDESFENISDETAAAAIQTTQQNQSVTISAYAHLIKLLDEMDPKKLKTAVEEALKSYREKNTGRFNLHFFRQFYSDGRDYAANAQARINDAAPDEKAKQNVAREIAREILFMGVQPDGENIEVKHNSRVHHLLMALQEQRENAAEEARDSSTSALVNHPKGIDFKSLGVMGCSFEVEKLKSAAGRQVPKPRQSL